MAKKKSTNNGQLTFCVCGGGSLAHAVAAVLSSSPDNVVHVLTRQPARWSKNVLLNYRNESYLSGKLKKVAADPAEVVPEADIILVLVPHAAREEVLVSIAPYVQEKAWVGAFPGFAGFAWQARYYLGRAIRVFGLQRVPYVCKKQAYGRQVLVRGIRPRHYVASVPAAEVNEIAAILSSSMNLLVVPVPHYLNICFSRSNSVFHPARIFGRCQDWKGGRRELLQKKEKFYRDWDERSSEIFLALDDEMTKASALLPADTRWALPVLQHYEIAFGKDLTVKIRSIEALSDRWFPLHPSYKGFIPATDSYYFTEDITYGLTTLKALYTIAGSSSPVTDKILQWAGRILNMQWTDEKGNLLFSVPGMPWPQRFGITSPEKLDKFCETGVLPNYYK